MWQLLSCLVRSFPVERGRCRVTRRSSTDVGRFQKTLKWISFLLPVDIFLLAASSDLDLNVMPHRRHQRQFSSDDQVVLSAQRRVCGIFHRSTLPTLFSSTQTISGRHRNLHLVGASTFRSIYLLDLPVTFAASSFDAISVESIRRNVLTTSGLAFYRWKERVLVEPFLCSGRTTHECCQRGQRWVVFVGLGRRHKRRERSHRTILQVQELLSLRSRRKSHLPEVSFCFVFFLPFCFHLRRCRFWSRRGATPWPASTLWVARRAMERWPSAAKYNSVCTTTTARQRLRSSSSSVGT